MHRFLQNATTLGGCDGWLWLSTRRPRRALTMTIRIFGIAAALVASAFSFAGTVQAQEPKPVRTDAGAVQGSFQEGLAIYRGIPFAEPPLGGLRWRAPQPHVPWTEVLKADKFAP